MKQGASIQSQNVKANRKLEKTAHPRYSGSCGDYLDSRSEKTVVREKSWRQITRGLRAFCKNSVFQLEKQMTSIQLSKPQRVKSPAWARSDCMPRGRVSPFQVNRIRYIWDTCHSLQSTSQSRLAAFIYVIKQNQKQTLFSFLEPHCREHAFNQSQTTQWWGSAILWFGAVGRKVTMYFSRQAKCG